MSKTEDGTGQKTLSNRTATKVAGALIILGYLAYGLPNAILIQPLLTAADPLASVSADTTKVNIGALLMAINCVAVVGISLMLYPTLKEHSEWIALSYVGTRIFEAIVLIGGILSILLLVPVSQNYVQASAADASSFDAVATTAIHGEAMAYQIGMMGLAIGSLPFCYLLYQTELVPRVIAVLGLVGYPALFVLMVAEIFTGGVDPIIYALMVPGMLFELGIALWLIIKGFNSSAIASRDPSETVPEPAR